MNKIYFSVRNILMLGLLLFVLQVQAQDSDNNRDRAQYGYVAYGADELLASLTEGDGKDEIEGDVSNLRAGIYSVVTSDTNGYESTADINIEEQEEIRINVIANIPDHNNSGSGAIDIEVTGGVSPYEMTWTEAGSVISTVEDIYDLLSGTYNLNVTDANGLSVDESIRVLNFNAPAANFTSNTTISCAGQTMEFTDLSTNTPTSRSWEFEGGFPSISSIATPLVVYNVPGTYTVTLTAVNAYGTDIKTGTININSALEIVYSALEPLCNSSSDGEIDLTVSGGSDSYDYLWNIGSTFEDLDGLPAGSYTVLVKDQNSCTTKTTIELSSPDEIEIEITNILPDSCNGSTGMVELLPTGGNPDYTVLWNDPRAQFDFTLQNVSVGSYTATITDANFCAEEITVDVQQVNCVGLVEDTESLKDIIVYPNPSSGERLFFISETKIEMNISMFDITGRKVGIQLFEVGDNITELYPKIRLSDGIYFVKFQHGDAEVTKKVSVNK